MKILADYHVHSDFSTDSDTLMEATIERAIELGLTRLCFTDHMDYDFPKGYFEEEKPFEFDVEQYIRKIEDMNRKYGSDIKILTGIELGIKTNIVKQLNNLLDQYSFDFVIASSHLLDNYDPYFPDYWETIQNDSAQGIRNYFKSICENIEAFQNFDVYGHLDYIVRYVPDKNFIYNPDEFQEEIDEVLKTIIKYNKGIEVNTAGLKYGLPFAHPHSKLLKRYLELGGTTITIGSDAHKPEHLAYDFDKVADILKESGITSYNIFENRKIVETVKL